ncbi:MAG: flagellar hook protein FlgE [Anaerolineae bacterium]|nr:flagellar hook protein FlgE [Anaerolineae bacterium]
MMRSLSSAIAALKNHQLYLDVIAANISNVNTTAYKSSKISFQELLSQTIRPASAPQGGLGGRNSVQVGLGMALGSVSTDFTQGSPQATGKMTDLAIQGDGFFVVQGPLGNMYTRDGTVDIGLDGSLVSLATGMHLLGWPADATGAVNTTDGLGPIAIPFGQSMARATSEVRFKGNLAAEAEAGDTVTTQFGVYDSLGVIHTLEVVFTRNAGTPATWTLTASELTVAADGSVVRTPVSSISDNTIEFDEFGQIVDENAGSEGTESPTLQLELAYDTGAVTPALLTVNLATVTGLSGKSEVNPVSQDGLESGSLVSFSVDVYGQVVGVFSNGLNRTLGQLALAKFINPGGLLRQGENLYSVSTNSGTPQHGEPGQDGRGLISAGYLEASNVDLAQQFTNMIVAQRGFQANSRIISTSDEMLNELVNLKR